MRDIGKVDYTGISVCPGVCCILPFQIRQDIFYAGKIPIA